MPAVLILFCAGEEPLARKRDMERRRPSRLPFANYRSLSGRGGLAEYFDLGAVIVEMESIIL